MRGGRRPGAGRKKGKEPLARVALRAYFEEQAREAFAPILVQYFRLAEGKPSDADARVIIDFFNRVLGKPPESMTVSGTGQGGSVHLTFQQIP